MTKIVLIVGPSGAGKDTLLRTIKDKIDANLLNRYITRKPDKNENNFYVEDNAFEILKQNGYFVSTWEAHGNKYGIPKANIVEDKLSIISISRKAIKDFELEYENVFTINITISKDILMKRLISRGRETEAEIKKRLDRSDAIKIDAKNLIEFDNSIDLESSSENFIKLLKSL